ncbi:tetratricopeptide repeat protein [Shiella aurantiaca]|nr:tetratricopeptide repeat protein [Shiella aurantiaca]
MADSTAQESYQILAERFWFSDPLRSIAYAKLALSDAREHANALNEARALSALGTAYWVQGNQVEALQQHYAALKINESLKDSLGIATCNSALGKVYLDISNYSLALEYFQKAGLYFKSLGEKTNYGHSLNNIGACYSKMGEWQKALNVYREAQTIFDKLQDSHDLAATYSLLAETFIKDHMLDSAEWYIHQAIRMQEVRGNALGLSISYIQLARVQTLRSDWNKALETAQMAMNWADEIGAKKSIRDAHRLLSEIYQQQLNYKLAFENQRLATRYEDSLRSEEIIRMVEAARFEREIVEKESENQLLREREAESQALIQKQFIVVVLVVIVMCLAFLLFALAYRSGKKDRLHNAVLARKNNEINNQKEELEVQAEKIRLAYNEIFSINKSLEEKILERTADLEKRNEQLEEYAFINSHKLRAPVASILGLVSLIDKEGLNEKEQETISHLTQAAEKLDNIVKEITSVLEPDITKES